MLGKSVHSFTATVLLAGSVLALGALLTPSGARSQSSSTESVADAARKSREAKKTAPAGTKVYTDDDVKPAVAAANPAPAGQPGSDGAAATGAAQTAPNGDPNAQPADAASSDGKGDKKDDKKDGKADEKAWRARFKAQRDQLARLEQELDVLQREQNKAQVQYYPDPQKALSEGYTRKDINDKDVKIAAKKDEIAKQQQSISDLEDELRASGGDPGWAR